MSSRNGVNKTTSEKKVPDQLTAIWETKNSGFFFFPFYHGTIRIIVYSCSYYSSSVIGIGPYEGRICLAPFLVVFCKIIQSSTDHKKGTEKEYCLCIVKVTLFFVFKVLKRNN